MRRITLLFLSLNWLLTTQAQRLNVDETISYINEQAKRYAPINPYETFEKIEINISDYGLIHITTKYTAPSGTESLWDYIAINGKNAIFFDNSDYRYPRIKISSSSIQDKGYNTFTSSYVLRMPLAKEGLDKIVNAFNYLLELIRNDPKYKDQIDDDPFSNQNYRSKVIVDNSHSTNKSHSANKDTINLTPDGNLSKIRVSVCGIMVDMILDSGADDVTISTTVEKELIEKGLISKESYLTPGLYKIADGSVVKSRRFVIPYLKVGEFTVKDVNCNVSPSEDVLLLGKSFLNKFGKWTLDNGNHSLILEK